jgi:hypothetical protein
LKFHNNVSKEDLDKINDENSLKKFIETEIIKEKEKLKNELLKNVEIQIKEKKFNKNLQEFYKTIRASYLLFLLATTQQNLKSINDEQNNKNNKIKVILQSHYKNGNFKTENIIKLNEDEVLYLLSFNEKCYFEQTKNLSNEKAGFDLTRKDAITYNQLDINYNFMNKNKEYLETINAIN